jgi:SAM-dependent methyltransferase
MTVNNNIRFRTKFTNRIGRIANGALEPFGIKIVRISSLADRNDGVPINKPALSRASDNDVYPTPSPHFTRFSYQQINDRRMEHLSSLGLDIPGLSVLEVGAGIGDLTSFFIDRGCEVVTSDARQENIDVIRSRYPGLKTLILDLDNPVENSLGLFEVVFCYGVLYHLGNPAQAIAYLSRKCSNLLLLETRVSCGEGESTNLLSEDLLVPTESRWGRGCKPTRKWVYNRLKEQFEFVYMPTTQPWHEEFPIDWASPATPQSASSRSIFIASRQRLRNSLLEEGIPMKQIRS